MISHIRYILILDIYISFCSYKPVKEHIWKIWNSKLIGYFVPDEIWHFSYETIFESQLPIINLKESEASFKLTSALKEWGFAYITGHDISAEVVERAYLENKNFFDLPMRTKRDLQADRRLALKTTRGYTRINAEQLDVSPNGRPDIKEVFDVGYTNPSAGKNAKHHLGRNKWPRIKRPNGPRGKREIGDEMKTGLDEYTSHISSLAKNLLGDVFTELGCEKDLGAFFGTNALQVLRLTRYPASNSITKQEYGQIGAGVHSDYGGITVLSAQGQGLSVLKPNRSSEYQEKGTFSDELLIPNNNHWVEVPSINNTFIVMAGEALQRLSNGHVYAVKHKVELSETLPRYSLAFFHDPNPESVLKPMECVTKNHSPIYGAKVAGHKGVIRNVLSN